MSNILQSHQVTLMPGQTPHNYVKIQMKGGIFRGNTEPIFTLSIPTPWPYPQNFGVLVPRDMPSQHRVITQGHGLLSVSSLHPEGFYGFTCI